MTTHLLPFELTEDEDYSLRWIADRYDSAHHLYHFLTRYNEIDDVNLRVMRRLSLEDGADGHTIPCLGGRVRDWLKEIGF